METTRAALRISAEPRMVERCRFYERGRRAFCVAATSEPRQYANVILKKGIVK